jgi:hypothetical protein
VGGSLTEEEREMTSKLHLGGKIRQAGLLMVLVTAMLAATTSPASAYTVATTSGSVGARTPDVPAFPNKCYSKNFYSGEFDTTMVWVSRTNDPRYVKSVQYISSWLTLKRYNSTTRTWVAVPINGVASFFLGELRTEFTGTTAPVTTLNTARFLPITISNLSAGWYTVEFQYHWRVDGAGYIGYAKDVYNNDTYRRFLGVSINSGDDSVTSTGMCYVD